MAFQVFGLLLVSLVLDAQFAGAVVFTIIGYWFGVLLILFRRGKDPSRLDLLFERWGFPVLWFVVTLPVLFICRLAGLRF
jgi:hypothetical protein